MTIPSNIQRIAKDISATVTRDDRATLAGYLSDIASDDELFLRCVRKACVRLGRYSDKDVTWLRKWVPILLRDVQKLDKPDPQQSPVQPEESAT